MNTTENLTPEEQIADFIYNKVMSKKEFLENKRDMLPSDKPLVLKPYPSAFALDRPMGTKGRNKVDLNEKIHEVTKDLDTNLYQALKTDNPKVLADFKKQAQERRDLRKLEKEQGKGKDMDASQRFLNKLKQRVNDKVQDDKKQKQPDKTQASKTKTPQQTKKMSMSTRFNQSLGFTQWQGSASSPSQTQNKSKPKPKGKDKD